MKLLQLLENTQQFPDTKEEVEAALKYLISNYTINGDMSVDVDGDVNLYKKRLGSFPVKFGKVSGNFYCNENNLTSLLGAPREVGGDFSCSRNLLTSLLGAPREVGGDFLCNINKLTSLQSAPREVGGNFDCSHNKLITLKGSPPEVGGNFICYDNKLTTLMGSPREVGGFFDCRLNDDLVSLDGIGNVHGQIITSKRLK